MRRFSRWMPLEQPQGTPLIAWLPTVGYAGMMALLAIPFPSLWLVLAGWPALNVPPRGRGSHRWRARGGQGRHGDIGRFARSVGRAWPAPVGAWGIRAMLG